MTDCIFCKIIAGKIPCAKIYENGKVIAFLDISPVNPGHALVVPKKHFEKFEDLPDNLLCEIMRIIKKLSKAIMRAVNTDSFNLGLNNGKAAGQLVPHVHFHVMPRFFEDGHEHWKGRKYADGEMQKVAEKIKSLLK